jgi:predicted phosphodiesterase
LSWILQAPAADVEFQLPLTVRHVTDTTAVLQFTLEESVPARLLAWRQSDHGDLREIQIVDGQKLVNLQGLAPGTDYQAAVLVEGDPLSRPTLLAAGWPLLHFRTMDYSAQAMKVAVFGDSGFGDQVTMGIAQQIAAEGVDFVLHTGDIVYRVNENPNPPAAYKLKLYKAHQPILVNFPFYPVTGNHEFDTPTRWQGRPYYFEAFPAVEGVGIQYPAESDGSWYAVVHDGVQFLMLNSQVLFGEPGEAEQREWLADRIDDPEVRYSIIVIHVPPYNLGRHQTESAVVRTRLGDLLIDPRVPLVLSGHDHNYQRWQIDSTAVVVSGGGSVVLYDLAGGDPRYQAGARASHHVLLTIGQSSIELSALDKKGDLIDQVVLETP